MPEQPSTFVPLVIPPTSSMAHEPPEVHRYIHVIGADVWVHEEPIDDSWDRHFLGLLDGQGVWGVDVPHGNDPADGASTDLYSYFGRSTENEWLAAGRAVQIVEWARTHRFCGRCATPTELAPGERAMKCPSCDLLAFPRIAPAMITLVTRGSGANQEALLAYGVKFRSNVYSCLAGFVEPGESLEGAVVREVREEVGLEVANVRYWGSQPWPFPHSLMLGFHAEYQSGKIVCEPTEILDANWYRRDALPPIPPRISIARNLIDAWLRDEV